ncbi:hypothetical protein NECAME_10258 [Necator americanus]|uniref:Uncharacterized protein n=1 Tax=Necator americanus TaxID=51031 RepID=W2TC31_NECAM|nr:hypothetical protein NECAME_10258 [Necator americanus]ETN78562.1 hypothetical protein NECAME_10258 [Necator americanus]
MPYSAASFKRPRKEGNSRKPAECVSNAYNKDIAQSAVVALHVRNRSHHGQFINQRRPHKPTSPQNPRQHNDERVTRNTHSRPRSRSNTRNEQSQIRHPIRTTHHAHLSDGTPEHNKQDTVGEFQEPSSSYTVTVTSNNDNHDDIHQGNSILLMYTKVTLMNP